MKVVEHIERAERPLISFEIIPPLRGGTLQRLLDLIEALRKYRPPFIDITSHAAETIFEETHDGIKKRVKRKRPGTLGLCALIQHKYQIDTVPHLLCHGFTREETEDMLIELRYLGIQNVLAVRGDHTGYVKPVPDGRTANTYACDLVQQITNMNHGEYIEEGLLDADPSSFCIGVGGYPEKHFEAPNLEMDVRFTKKKVDAGAEYIVTQMFYDNRDYFRYVDACRAAGIEVPIIPGLKILTSADHLSSLPRNFYISIPTDLSDAVHAAKTKNEVLNVGVEWALHQALELLERDVPSVHFYVMSNAKAVSKVLDQIDL